MTTLIDRLCIYYPQGRCAKGDQCHFSHAPIKAPSRHREPRESVSALPQQPSPSTRPVCSFFQRGICRFEQECQFYHPSPASNVTQPSPAFREATLRAKHAELSQVNSDSAPVVSPPTGFGPCKFFLQRTCTKGTACPFPHPGAFSSDRDHLGCQVVYGPGAAVQSITTAFESSSVLLHNLPSTATHADLIAHAEPFGALKSVILNPPRAGDPLSRPSARIEYLSAADAAQAVASLAQRLRAPETTARLDLRAAASGTAVLRSTKVKVSWFAPSLAAWAHYGALTKATQEAGRLDGMSFNGRTIRASFQAPSWNQTRSFSVELKGLPLDASSVDLKRFCRASSVRLGQASFTVDDSVKATRALLSIHGPLESFDVMHPDQQRNGTVARKPNPKLVAFAQFADADSAARAVAALHSSHQPYLRGSQLFLQLVHSFAALRAEMDALRGALETCKLRFHERDEHGAPVDRVYVRAYGADAKALCRLKDELEALLKGEVVHGSENLVVWHDHFSSFAGKVVLDTLAAETQTYIRSDVRTRTIHLFGAQAARAAARGRVLDKARALDAEEHFVELDAEAFRRMLHGGFQHIQTAVGADKVFLDVVHRRLVIQGDDVDIRAVRAAIPRPQQTTAGRPVTGSSPAPSMSISEAPCPICFCDSSESDPHPLPCGHTYCRVCLQHYLRSLAHSFEGGGPASAVCLADSAAPKNGAKAQCKRDIPLDTIRALLSPGEEEELLEATFLAHIHGRPQEYRYCPTADCETIYRAAQENTLLRCPACLARICASCHVEAHGGLSCAEYKDCASGGEQSFQRWRAAHDVKACPKCGTDVEKNGGCNHMRCVRCGTHMCWICMQVFTEVDSSGGVYAHMRKTHGGIGI
ncbi:hypothetical protein BD413DRAFT_605706 [Trametes elegans]|nr:hypothetical protein BD413DRAFT_605706 [Trametes elegans]